MKKKKAIIQPTIFGKLMIRVRKNQINNWPITLYSFRSFISPKCLSSFLPYFTSPFILSFFLESKSHTSYKLERPDILLSQFSLSSFCPSSLDVITCEKMSLSFYLSFHTTSRFLSLYGSIFSLVFYQHIAFFAISSYFLYLFIFIPSLYTLFLFFQFSDTL